MTRPTLVDLTERLRRRGLARDADEVAALGRAVESVRRPPGIFARLTTSAREKAVSQWRLALDEWSESRAVFRIVRDKITRGIPLEPAEAADVRGQLTDLLKTLPASVVAAATACVPVPGAMLATPWVLRRLGLLPSRWREAAVLDRLRAEAGQLRAHGEETGARALDDVAAEIEGQRRAHLDVEERSLLRTHWDLDGDGRLDEHELAAYEAEVARLTALVPAVGAARRWYVSLDDDVIGPVRWGETASAEPSLPLLVCLDGESGWVRLSEVRERAGFPADDAR